MGRKWRGDMQDEIGAACSLRPACIGLEIGNEKAQAIARIDARNRQHGQDIGLALFMAQRRADAMAGHQQGRDAVNADETRSAGDKNCGHGRSPLPSSQIEMRCSETGNGTDYVKARPISRAGKGRQDRRRRR